MPTTSKSSHNEEDLYHKFSVLQQNLSYGLSSVVNLGKWIVRISGNEEVNSFVAKFQKVGEALTKLDIKKPVEAAQTLINFGENFIQTAEVLDKVTQSKDFVPKLQSLSKSNLEGFLESVSDTVEKVTPILQATTSVAALVVPPPVGTGLMALNTALPLLKKACIGLKSWVHTNKSVHHRHSDDEYDQSLPKVKTSLIDVLNYATKVGTSLSRVISKKELSQTISSCRKLKEQLTHLDLKNPLQVGEVFTSVANTLDGLSKVVDEVKQDKTLTEKAKAVSSKASKDGTLFDSALKVIEKVDYAIKVSEPIVEKFAPAQVSIGLKLLKKSLPWLKLSCNGLKVALGSFFTPGKDLHASAKQTATKHQHDIPHSHKMHHKKGNH